MRRPPRLYTPYRHYDHFVTPMVTPTPIHECPAPANMMTTAQNPYSLPPSEKLSLSSVQAATDVSNGETGSTEEIVNMVRSLNVTLDVAIAEIIQINSRTKLLALNARIEAARAAEYGASFGVVASEMQKLASNTSQAADQLASNTRPTIERLLDTIGMTVRGNRLSDMALVNIDLIDRNLYERSCDVRWWATDSAPVEALTTGSSKSADYACDRLGTILNSYTVYWDLVLCDSKGKVIANGRPALYKSIGRDVSSAKWFTGAMATRSGEQFAFASALQCDLVDTKSSLIYSAAVREDGRVNGKAIGVLGIIFNWEALSSSIVANTPLNDRDRRNSRIAIVDPQGQILADSNARQSFDQIPSSWLESMSVSRKGFTKIDVNGKPHCLAFADSPGYETYSTGWKSLLLQAI